MIYVALLRGINVGGKSRVEMARLKTVFEKLGYQNVTTYINSGNVVFSDGKHSIKEMVQQIEAAIQKEFGIKVPVVVRDHANIKAVSKALLSAWQNNAEMKADVMFLWEGYDHADVLKSLTIKPELDDVKYVSGAILWRADRKNVTRSGMMKIVGTELYKNMTIRNVNSVRKIYGLMGQIDAF